MDFQGKPKRKQWDLSVFTELVVETRYGGGTRVERYSNKVGTGGGYSLGWVQDLEVIQS